MPAKIQPDPDRDRRILNMWRDGKRALDIAGRVGLTEARVLHELNRILREAHPLD